MKSDMTFTSALRLFCILLFVFAIALPDVCVLAVGPDDYFEDENGHVSLRFSSHLPLVLLEFQDDTIDISDAKSAVLSIIDNGYENRLNSLPEFKSGIKIAPMLYESAQSRPKQDYFVSLEDASAHELAGLPANKSWALLGGAYDKSLIRNYIGYTLAAMLMENVPKVRFCELVIKQGDMYSYRGCYLLVEGDLPKNSIAIQRTDNYGQNMPGLKVIESGMGNFVLPDYWGGDEKENEQIIRQALETVSGMFYAEDTNHFLRYGEVIDRKAYITHFLINECLGSYSGISTDMYMYNKTTRRFVPGPFRSFESSLDNQKSDVISLGRIEYQNAPFYSFMVEDSEFIDELINMSRKYIDIMSSKKLNSIIDEAVSILGAAQMRDWYRWENVYFAPENALEPYVHSPGGDVEEERVISRKDGILPVALKLDYELSEEAPPKIREFEKYEQEIIRMRFFVNQRPDYARRALPILKNQKDLLSKIHSYRQNTIFAALFLVLLSTTIFLTRRNSA